MKKGLLLSLLFTAVFIAGRAQDISIGAIDSIKSEVLDEVRYLKIFTPPSYKSYSTSSYPVTYILDGDFLFHTASGMVEYMSKTGQLPEMILVCISNNDRTRDFTPSHTLINYEGEQDESLNNSGGGPAFLKFLNTELVGYINEKYRTNGFNTLVGRSLGGLIAARDLLDEHSQMDRFILIDPSLWWDEDYLVNEIDSFMMQGIKARKVYISSSDNLEFSDYILRMRESQERFVRNLKENNFPASSVLLDYFEEESHGTVTIPSLRAGLLFVFSEYYLKGMKYRTADEIIEHFHQIKTENNADFPPLEGMINWLASQQKDNKGRIDLLLMNAANYPESIGAKLKLADAYLESNMRQEAKEVLEKALTLDTDNEEVKLRIEKLKK